MLLLVATTATTTAQTSSKNDLLMTLDLLKWKWRTKNENGEYRAWRNLGKRGYTIGIHGDHKKGFITFVNIKKQIVTKSYTHTGFYTEQKDNIDYMTFSCIDNYGEPLKLIVSYYPATATYTTAKWIKVNMVYEKTEYEHEAKWL